MAVDPHYVQQIYNTDLARPTGVTQDEIDYWVNSGLEGDALVRTMRTAAGLDNTLLDDAAYSAYDRYRRQRQSKILADRTARQAEMQRDAELARGQLDDQLSQGYRSISRNYGNRGLTRSGGYVNSRAELAGQIQDKRNKLESDLAAGQSDLLRSSEDQLAELSRQRDEQEIAARSRLTQRSIEDMQLGYDSNARINAAYQNVFGREADQAGRLYWRSPVVGGMSQADLENNLRQSEEYKRRG